MENDEYTKDGKDWREAIPQVDPFAIMWTDPITVSELFNRLPDEQKEAISKVIDDFARSVNNSLDALMGKDKYPLARVFLVQALNVANQNEILRIAGISVDDIGCPIDETGENWGLPVDDDTNPEERPDNDEDEDEIEGEPEDPNIYRLPNVVSEGKSRAKAD